MQLASFTNKMIHESFKVEVRTERKITANVLEFIREIYQRKLFLEMGYASLLEYLIEEGGYSKTAALRRMDAAKLLIEFPELKEKFASGSLNLSQASLFAQGLRQKIAEQKKACAQQDVPKDSDVQPSIFDQAPAAPLLDVQHKNLEGERGSQIGEALIIEASSLNQNAPELSKADGKSQRRETISAEQKREILEQIENQTYEDTQKALAQAFSLPTQHHEKRRFQKDNSVRAEITFSEEESRDLERAKELLSHVHPAGKLQDVIAYMTKFFLDRKDPKRKKVAPLQVAQVEVAQPEVIQPRVPTSDSRSDSDLKIHRVGRPSAADIRVVHHRDQCCQWRDPETGRQCQSRFQLQTDHKQAKWAGGGDEIENLQVLCAAHNRLKYQKESNLAGESSFYSAWELIGDFG